MRAPASAPRASFTDPVPACRGKVTARYRAGESERQRQTEVERWRGGQAERKRGTGRQAGRQSGREEETATETDSAGERGGSSLSPLSSQSVPFWPRSSPPAAPPPRMLCHRRIPRRAARHTGKRADALAFRRGCLRCLGRDGRRTWCRRLRSCARRLLSSCSARSSLASLRTTAGSCAPASSCSCAQGGHSCA